MHAGSALGLWLTALEKDSRHAGRASGLWLTALAKDSGHAGSALGLLVYYVREGFKAC